MESSPEVLTALARDLGATRASVVDVFGFDDDLLSFIPGVPLALLLCFPSRDLRERGALVRPPAAAASDDGAPPPGEPFYLSQKGAGLDNACGTIALLHGLLNNRDALGWAEGSPLGRYHAAAVGSGYAARGKALDDSAEIAALHDASAVQGQSSAVASADVAHHYLCLTAHGGRLVSLDGAYAAGPVDLGSLDGAPLLRAAGRHVIAEYVEKAGGNLTFSALALVADAGDDDGPP